MSDEPPMTAEQALDLVAGEWAGIGRDSGVREVEALDVLREVVTAARLTVNRRAWSRRSLGLHLDALSNVLDGRSPTLTRWYR